MTFDAPEWFILLAAFLLAGWFWPRLQLWRPLRALSLLLLTLLLVDPRIQRQENNLDLWVLLDRSASTESLVDEGLPEWNELLRRSKPSRRDQLLFIDYAAEVLERGTGDAAVYTGGRQLTRTNLALQNVLALADADRPARLLLFTDGYATEPLVEAAAKLKTRGIPLDYRIVREQDTGDFRVAHFHAPSRSQVGEPFVLTVAVRGHQDIDIPIRILRDDRSIADETTVSIIDGVGKIEFTDRIPVAGSYKYTAEIIPPDDAHLGNNRTDCWVEITGGPRILLVTKYSDDPVAASLRSQGFTVETVTNSLELRVGQLSGARAVILNNVPAFEIPGEFLEGLDFFVREQGGGLMMAGGKQSFGSGGYFRSAVDPLLPVSMELKTEHRKLAVAMGIVMDRSGSMSISVPSGGKHVSKMDLANTGAAGAIELLGQQDQICVFAVDSEPHEIIGLTQIGNNKDSWMKRVRSVKSTGGGIYVYRGLKAAWDELKPANIGTRHIILFSDAADSEQPGNYKDLLREITNEGGTVSVIGLGTPADQDAALLEDIATLGGGRIFFTNRPLDLPRLFAQETVTVARSAFVKDPVTTQATGHWSEISPRPFEFLGEVDGYNLSYAREDATTSLAAQDEYLGPLVVHARRGIGRTVAVSFPLGGEHSEKVRAWPQYGDFLQTLGRWLMGFELPPGLGMKHRIEGTRLTVDLFYDSAEWADRFAEQPPRIKLLEDNGDGEPYEVFWKRIAPGHFSMSRELEEGTVLRGAVQAGPHGIPFGPLVVGSSTEWAFDPDRLAELREVSRLSGGRELLDLTQAWVRPSAIRTSDLRVPLVILSLLLMLLDALVTRMGWRLPIITRPARPRRPSSRAARPAKSRAPRAATSPHPAPATPEPSEPSAEPTQPRPVSRPDSESSSSRSSRFDRAKRRR